MPGVTEDLTARLQATLGALEEARYAAMLRRDAAALAVLLDDDLVYTHSFGEQDSKADYLAKLEAGYFDYLSIRHEIARVIPRDGAGVVIGRMTAEARVGGAPRRIDNAYAAVWGRSDAGDWRLIAFQPTPLGRR